LTKKKKKKKKLAKKVTVALILIFFSTRKPPTPGHPTPPHPISHPNPHQKSLVILSHRHGVHQLLEGRLSAWQGRGPSLSQTLGYKEPSEVPEEAGLQFGRTSSHLIHAAAAVAAVLIH